MEINKIEEITNETLRMVEALGTVQEAIIDAEEQFPDDCGEYPHRVYNRVKQYVNVASATISLAEYELFDLLDKCREYRNKELCPHSAALK